MTAYTNATVVAETAKTAAKTDPARARRRDGDAPPEDEVADADDESVVVSESSLAPASVSIPAAPGSGNESTFQQ